MTTSLSTKLVSLLKSAETAFSLFTSMLSTCAFNLGKSDIAAKLYISTPVIPFKSASVA